MKNLILTTAIIICSLHIKAQTLNKYHGGNADGYASATGSKSTALPVVLTDFTAEVDHATVTIKWSTSFEMNSELFIVQRSRDGIEFQYVGSLIPIHNSNRKVSYSISDQLDSQTGTWYYKLLQKDINQEAKSIGVKAVTITQPIFGPTISVYPNPANTNIVLVKNGEDCINMTTIVILSNDSKIYYNGTYTNGGIDVSNYPDGIYYLSVFGERRNEALKFVVKH